MSEAVLDASVLLAILKGEPYHEWLTDVTEGAVMGAVNLSEVLAKAAELGIDRGPMLEHLIALLDRVEPLTEIQARIAASLRMPTRHLGLSLGDRACLALALDLGAEVYTAEKKWNEVSIDCVIHQIR